MLIFRQSALSNNTNRIISIRPTDSHYMLITAKSSPSYETEHTRRRHIFFRMKLAASPQRKVIHKHYRESAAPVYHYPTPKPSSCFF